MEVKEARFEVKQIAEDGTFTGYAAVFGTPDDSKDVIERKAFDRTLAAWEGKGRPIPICNQHDLKDVIGAVEEARPDDVGLFVKGRFLLGVQSGREMYERVKARVVSAMSFGYVAVQKEFKNGMRHLKEVRLLEVSPVLVGMHGDAGVLSVKAKGEGKPYGDVPYADPGYQEDGVKRYPIDTEKHVRAAWSYVNKPRNAKMYDAADLKKVRAKIVAAWKKLIDPDGPPAEDAGKAALVEAVDSALEALAAHAEIKVLMFDYLAEEQARQRLQDVWWKLRDALDSSVRETICDDSMSAEARLADVQGSLEQFAQAATEWARAEIARHVADEQADGEGGGSDGGDAGAMPMKEADVEQSVKALASLAAAIPAARPDDQAKDADARDHSAVEAPESFVTAVRELRHFVNARGQGGQ